MKTGRTLYFPEKFAMKADPQEAPQGALYDKSQTKRKNLNRNNQIKRISTVLPRAAAYRLREDIPGNSPLPNLVSNRATADWDVPILAAISAWLIPARARSSNTLSRSLNSALTSSYSLRNSGSSIQCAEVSFHVFFASLLASIFKLLQSVIRNFQVPFWSLLSLFNNGVQKPNFSSDFCAVKNPSVTICGFSSNLKEARVAGQRLRMRLSKIASKHLHFVQEVFQSSSYLQRHCFDSQTNILRKKINFIPRHGDSLLVLIRSNYIKFDIKPLLYSSSLETNFNQCCLRVRLIIGLFLATLSLSSQADDFGELAKRCAPEIAEDTLRAIVKTESGFNPYAIGVVNGKVKQPKAYHEAMSTIAELELSGADYSVGLAQINRKNFSKYGISASQALDACTNLKVASRILSACFKSAKQSPAPDGKALHDALSCYYSGNFKTGYRHGYVDKVRSNAGLSPLSVPSIREVEVSKSQSLIAEGVPGKSSGLIF